MKKVVLTAFCLLLIGSMAFAQRPKTETFKGTISNIPGMQSSAPVTFTVDNTTGECSFVSNGNGDAVGHFTWTGMIPSAKMYSLGQAGAVWAGQLTNWSNMTIASGDSQSTMTAIVNGPNKAPIAGMVDSDGKSVRLTIRVPYQLHGQQANIPFTCTLNLKAGSNTDDLLNSDGFESLDDMTEEERNEYLRGLNERGQGVKVHPGTIPQQ